MEIGASARKHGIADRDIEHAVAHYAYIASLGEPGSRTLYLGPDMAGNILEVIVIERANGSEIAIHAMRIRGQYADLLWRRAGR